MTACPEEMRTLHYRGRWFGFGPVCDTERVIFAVFEGTPRSGESLSDNSFENNKLKKDEQSLARASFVTWTLFDKSLEEIGVALWWESLWQMSLRFEKFAPM
jgi:hypothetical protein